MPDLFGIDIAELVDQSISDGLPAAVLTRRVPGTRDSNDVTGGTQPISSTFSARGFFEDYTDRDIDGSLVVVGDRKIVLITNSIQATSGTGTTEPEPSDKILLEGETWNVVRVKRDPAAATFVCQVRQ